MSLPYVVVLYYSRTGHCAQLAQHIARGIEKTGGIEARIRTVPSVAPTTQIADPDIPDQGPIYAELDDLAQCAGLIIGSPTRFGNMAAPLKYFLEQTTSLWLSGQLVDKPCAAFTSSGSMHGGQESTLLTMLLPLMHHGMIPVGIPYTHSQLSRSTSGGTPYGASHVAAHANPDQLTQDEIDLAQILGARVATISKRMMQ